jgi:hypothetical protein
MPSSSLLRQLYNKEQYYLKEIKDLEPKIMVDGKINITAYNKLQFFRNEIYNLRKKIIFINRGKGYLGGKLSPIKILHKCL